MHKKNNPLKSYQIRVIRVPFFAPLRLRVKQKKSLQPMAKQPNHKLYYLSKKNNPPMNINLIYPVGYFSILKVRKLILSYPTGCTLFRPHQSKNNE